MTNDCDWLCQVPEDWSSLELHFSSWARLDSVKSWWGAQAIEAFEFLKLVPTAEGNSKVPKETAQEIITQTPSLLPLRVGPDESLQKTQGDSPPPLCAVWLRWATCAPLAPS